MTLVPSDRHALQRTTFCGDTHFLGGDFYAHMRSLLRNIPLKTFSSARASLAGVQMRVANLVASLPRALLSSFTASTNATSGGTSGAALRIPR